MTYEDVTNIDAVGVITARSDVSIADKIIHTGDTNTAIRFPAADTFSVETGGSERLRITSDGNLVMNGASPNHDASSGSIFLIPPSGNPNRGIKWSDTSDTHYVKLEPSVIDGLTINGYSGVAFATGSRSNSTWAERLRIISDGKIGVGVVSPQQKLDVVGSAHTVAVFRPDTNTVSTYGDASVVNNLVNLRMPYGSNPGSQTNNGARWGIKFQGRNDGAEYGTDAGKSASIYAVSEETNSGYNRQVGLAFYTSPFDANQQERLRIASDGKIGLDGMTNPVAKLHIGTEDDATLTAQTLFVEGAKNGYAGYAGLPQNQLCVYDNRASTAGSGGAIGFAANCGGSQQTWIGAIESQRDSSTNNASNYAGSLVFWTRPAQSTPTEKLRIDSAGTIKCGTSATLKAEINSAIGGHQFISQCSDNNNGFEIYQQHGSTTTRNTFAVYANTGGGNAQELQFSIRGDGCVTKPKSPAFSANLAGGNLNMATHSSVIVFNNQHFDTGNNYNTSNGRFTAPVAGRYYFGVQIYAGFGSGAVRVLHAQFQKMGPDVSAADMFGGTSDAGGTSFHPTGCGHMLIDLATMIGLHSILEVSVVQEVDIGQFTLLVELDFSVI